MIPKGTHTDWKLWPLTLIPRRWTALSSEIPPVKLAGTAEGHLDIPARGTWAIAGAGELRIPVYFAITTKTGWHFHVGLLRYDYNDQFYEIGTLALRHYEN